MLRLGGKPQSLIGPGDPQARARLNEWTIRKGLRRIFEELKPLGHIAGTGAAVVGSLTTFLSLLFGLMIGQAYDGTVLPLIGGFAGLALAALLVMAWTERGRKFPG